MKPLDRIFEFKGNIPSICGLRLGENYHKLYDLVSSVQEKYTGDRCIDYLLNEYSVFVDIDTNNNDNISKIQVTYIPYSPFGYRDMKRIYEFFTKSFVFTSKVEHTEETLTDKELEYNYQFQLSNDSYQIEVKKTNDNPQLIIILTSPLDDIDKLQGPNIYYYHEPLGLYAVKDSKLGAHVGACSVSSDVEISQLNEVNYIELSLYNGLSVGSNSVKSPKKARKSEQSQSLSESWSP